MNVFIWGTGKYADIVERSLKPQCNLIGYIDSDIKKYHTFFHDRYMVYSPKEAFQMDFDKIIISATYYNSILEICRNNNISEERIIVFLSLQESNEILDYREKKIFELQEKCKIYEARLENKKFELGLGNSPIIKSAEELLNVIIHTHKSLARFGDGEFEIMCGRERAWFQGLDMELGKRLKEIIHSSQTHCLIAVANNFGNLDSYTEKAADAIRFYLQGKRDEIVDMIGTEHVFYDAYVTRPYMIYEDKGKANRIYKLFKKIWKNRNLLIVEGTYTRNGVNNDLFSTGNSVRRIIVPSSNAYAHYQNIINCVLKVAHKDDLILITLGPTATILAYDLSELGYQALDIGQVDNEYEWFQKGVFEKTPIEGKGVSELSGYREVEEILDEQYVSQIVCRIDGI